MTEASIEQLVVKLFTNPNDLTAEELGVLSRVPQEQPPSGTKSNFDDPANLQKQTIVISSVLLFFVCIFVAIRAQVKVGLSRKITIDDATLSVAILCMLFTYGAGLWGAERGKMGRHGWDISILTYIDPNYRIPAYINAILSPITLGFLKSSFFILYIQLFRPLVWVRICSWIGLVLNTCVYTAFTIMSFFYATPGPGKPWKQSSSRRLITLAIPVSIVGLVLDLAIFILPISAVFTLRMSARRKFGAALVFLSGLLACICSALSVYYRKLLRDGFDSNWYIGVIDIVYLVELMIGIVCACMPSAAYWYRHAPAAQSIRTSLSSCMPPNPSTQRTSQLSTRVWPAKKAQARAQGLAERYQPDASSDEILLSTIKGANCAEPSTHSMPTIFCRHQDFDVESSRRSSHPDVERGCGMTHS